MRKGKEASYWCDVTAEMMSDEEKVGDSYVRHPPSYRSKKITEFIHVLDCRAEVKGGAHPRVLGSPTNVAVPSSTKSWIVRKDLNTETAQESQNNQITINTDSPSIFSSDDESLV